MENYNLSMHLLGVRDQNLPVFKEARYRRLASIGKLQNMITVLPRLAPKIPEHLAKLDETDPEWDDKMIYPTVEHTKFAYQFFYWGALTTFYAYNWNVIHGNKRLRHLANLYPLLSLYMLGRIGVDYHGQVARVGLFESYCEERARELIEQNRFLLDHPHYKRYVYFYEDMKETLIRVHRQANDHEASDFKDSELLLQDFIRRYADPANPDAAIFTAEGDPKLLN